HAVSRKSPTSSVQSQTPSRGPQLPFEPWTLATGTDSANRAASRFSIDSVTLPESPDARAARSLLYASASVTSLPKEGPGSSPSGSMYRSGLFIENAYKLPRRGAVDRASGAKRYSGSPCVHVIDVLS